MKNTRLDDALEYIGLCVEEGQDWLEDEIANKSDDEVIEIADKLMFESDLQAEMNEEEVEINDEEES